ncbi:MAG TPA: geranylgeranyl reductase, partial [Prochlorococcus sp.]
GLLRKKTGYKPVPSAVRSDEEVNAMLAVKTIQGGIKVGRNKASSQKDLPANN